jgi:crotonobetainyl-CoA:carnitine CoA-transferase CaiB-like acyl-CoA transferase
LNARFADEDGYELTRRMLAAGLPAGPVLNVDEAMAEHRNMVTEIGAYREYLAKTRVSQGLFLASVGRRRRCGMSARSTTSKERSRCPMSTTTRFTSSILTGAI